MAPYPLYFPLWNVTFVVDFWSRSFFFYAKKKKSKSVLSVCDRRRNPLVVFYVSHGVCVHVSTVWVIRSGPHQQQAENHAEPDPREPHWHGKAKLPFPVVLLWLPHLLCDVSALTPPVSTECSFASLFSSCLSALSTWASSVCVIMLLRVHSVTTKCIMGRHYLASGHLSPPAPTHLHPPLPCVMDRAESGMIRGL